MMLSKDSRRALARLMTNRHKTRSNLATRRQTMRSNKDLEANPNITKLTIKSSIILREDKDPNSQMMNSKILQVVLSRMKGLIWQRQKSVRVSKIEPKANRSSSAQGSSNSVKKRPPSKCSISKDEYRRHVSSGWCNRFSRMRLTLK